MSNIDLLSMFSDKINTDWHTIRKLLLYKTKQGHQLSVEELIALRACDAVIDNDSYSADIVNRRKTESSEYELARPTNGKNILTHISDAMKMSMEFKKRR